MNKLAIFSIFLVVVVIIVISIYFGTKKSDENVRPELQFDNASKTLNPRNTESTDPSDAVVNTDEGYEIEYETGVDDSGNKSIDVTVSWTNGMGFDKVNKLIFRREVGGVKAQTDIVYDSGSGITDGGSGTIKFKGSDLTDASKSIIGVNKITVWYNDATVASNKLADTGEQIKIEQSDIDKTINLTSVEEVDIPITISYDSFKAEIVTRETLYFLEPFHICFKMKELGNNIVQFIQIKDNSVDNLWGTSETFKLKKYKDGYMLGHPTDSTKVLVRKVLTDADISWDEKTVNHTPTFKKLSEMNKDEYVRAKFNLVAARVGLKTGMDQHAYMEPGQSTISPNGRFKFGVTSDIQYLFLYDTVQQKDIWRSNKRTDCDKPVLQSDGNFFMVKKGTADDLMYGSHTWQWTARRPFRLVVGDDGTVAILKDDGRVIHYVTRFTPVSIACQGGNVPPWYLWSETDVSKSSLAVIHERWYRKENETQWIKLQTVGHAKNAGMKYVAFTISEGNVGHHYALFSKQLHYGRDFVYLPDGVCDKQSNSKNNYGSVITGEKPDTTYTSLYTGPEHVKFSGYTTWKIYYIPSLPLEGYVNNEANYEGPQNAGEQIKEKHFGAYQCQTRSKEFNNTNAYIYRHWRSETDGWSNTCAPLKLKNISLLKGNVNYETDPARHDTGCNDLLKNIRTVCTTSIDVPEEPSLTYDGPVR